MKEDEEKGYYVRNDTLDSIPVIVTKCRGDGLTKEMIEKMAANPIEVAQKVNS